MAYNNYLKKENIDSDGESRSRSASNGMETSIRKNYRNTPASISEDTDVGIDNPSVNKKQWIHRWILFKGKKKVVPLIMLVVIIGSAYGVYEKFFNLSDEERAQKELAAAIAAVGQLMILPEGDEPVLATVTDAEALVKQQAFFAGAINGDQLLLFPRNLKAILYSPSRNKIINAGPIEQQPQVAAPQSNAEQTQNNAESQRSSAFSPQESATVSGALTVEVRNGTGKNGFGARVADMIQKLDGFEVLKVGDAESKQHKKTILINRAESDSDKTKIQVLAATVGAEIQENLPAGEPSSSADAVIIVGGDRE